MMREAKRSREAAQFFTYQKRLLRTGIPPRDNLYWDREEQLLFRGSRMKTGINFDAYDEVDVERRGGRGVEVALDSFQQCCEQFNLPRDLTENIDRCAYNKPTPVQKHSVPAALVNTDVMVAAQTGSGKTAAFLVPLISGALRAGPNPLQEGPVCPTSVILAPTRELCQQITVEARKLCFRTPIRIVSIYGGADAMPQLKQLAEGCELAICTPGRLEDFLGRGVVSMENVRHLVLDEADRMLDMGFEPAVRAIVENHSMPSKEERQTMMFSATFAEECQKMAQDFLYDYIWIGVGVVGGAVETVEQRLEKVNPKEKYGKLVEILDDFFVKRGPEDRALVFVNAKDTAKWLDEQLYEKHMDTGALHGNLDQWEREKNLSRFRKGEIDVMIATDVAARGLDIESVVMVINYDMPQDIDSYIHRIGRTGRIGNSGTAITFISCDEQYGNCLENADTLKRLLQVMQDSKASVPDWLEGTVQEALGGHKAQWRWGGQDMRPDQETLHGNGAGGEWSNWRGGSSGGQQGQDAWKSSW